MATYKGVVPYGKYTFYPATQIIEFHNDYTGLALSDIMLITNVKSGTAITIYDPFDPAKGGTLGLVGGVITLTLNYNTTAMSNTDPLQIIVGMVNLPTALPTGAATETTLSSINTKTPSLGQALDTGSVPVVLTANQLSILTPLSSVSVSNFPATQSVSVTGSVAVTGPLTDAQLRASAVPVSLASLPALAAGSNTIGSIANTSFNISGTLPAFASTPTVNIGTSGLLALDTTLTAGNQKAIIRSGTKGSSTAADVTSTNVSVDTQALDVSVKGTATVTGTVTVNALPTGTNSIGNIGTLTSITNAVTVSQSTATSLKTQAENYQGGSAVSSSNPLQVTLANTGANATAIKVDGTGGTFPVNGNLTTVSTVTNLVQMNGAAISMGTGVRDAGTQRVTIATNDVVPASQSGTWTVQPGNTANTTPWLTRLSDGNNNVAIKPSTTPAAATDPALVVAISPNNSLSITGSVTANAGTNLNTSALAVESGGNLASIKTNTDNLALAQGSTTSGQKGNLAMASVSASAPAPTTGTTQALSLTTAGELRVGSDGCGVYQLVSAASNNVTSIKNGSTKIYGWYIYNNSTYPKKVILYNQPSSATITVGGTTPNVTLVIPASSGANVSLAIPIAFADGLWIATSGGTASGTTMQNSDSTPVSANDLNINLLYK